MSALSGGLYAGPGIIFLFLAILLGSRFTHSAPVYDEDTTQVGEYEGGGVASGGCYYNFQHYREADRIITNEPCLNCTCHNRMLMCYLRVCPFTKAIGQDCKVEKRADQCCPVITCPQVPVQLLTSTTSSPESTSSSTELGFRDNYGCTVDDKFYADGAQLSLDSHNPCELCYCIRNRTTCVMQQCTLRVAGCKPVYLPGVCCPVKYNCDYDDEPGTTVGPTPGLIMTTTIAPGIGAALQCEHEGDFYDDGQLIYSTEPCNHCYCFHGDIACAVQDCGAPMQSHGKNCTALPPPDGECCPTTYECEDESGVVESQQTLEPDEQQPEITTELLQATQATLPVNEESFPGADNSIPEIHESKVPSEKADQDSQQKTDEAPLTDATESPEKSQEKIESTESSTAAAVEDENRRTDAPVIPEIPMSQETDDNEQPTTVSAETWSVSASTEANNVQEGDSETTKAKEEEEKSTGKPIIGNKIAETPETTQLSSTVADETIKPEVEGTTDYEKKEEDENTEVAQTTPIAPVVEAATLPHEQVPEEIASSVTPEEQPTEGQENAQVGGISTESSPIDESATISDEEIFESSTSSAEISTEKYSAIQTEYPPASEFPVDKSTPVEEGVTHTSFPESATKQVPSSDETFLEEKPAEGEVSVETSTEPSEGQVKPISEKTTQVEKEASPAIISEQPVSTAFDEGETPTEGPTGIETPERAPETKAEDEQAVTEVQVTVAFGDAEHPELHTPENLVTETVYIAPTTYHPPLNSQPEPIEKEGVKANEQQSTIAAIPAGEAITLTSQTAENNKVTESSIDDENSIAPEHQAEKEEDAQHIPPAESQPSEPASNEPASTESSKTTLADSLEGNPIDAATTEASDEELMKEEGPTKGLTLESSSEESSEESSSEAPTAETETSSEEVANTETEPVEEIIVTAQSPTEAVSQIEEQSTESASSPVNMKPKEPITEAGLPPIVISIDEEKSTESSSTAVTEEQTVKPEGTSAIPSESPVTIEPEKVLTQQTVVFDGPTESSTTAQEEEATQNTAEIPEGSEEPVTVKEPDNASTDEESSQKPSEIPAESEEPVTVKEDSPSTADETSTWMDPADQKVEISSVPTENSSGEEISTTGAPVVVVVVGEEGEVKPATEESSSEETIPKEETTEIPLEIEERSTEGVPTSSTDKSTEIPVSDATTPVADLDASQQTEKIDATSEAEEPTEKSTVTEAETTEKPVEKVDATSEAEEPTEKSTVTEAETTENPVEKVDATSEAEEPTEKSTVTEAETTEKPVEKVDATSEAEEPTEKSTVPEAETTEKPVEKVDATSEAEEPTEKSTVTEAETTEKPVEKEAEPAESTEKSIEKEPESTEKSTEDKQPETTEKTSEKEAEITEVPIKKEEASLAEESNGAAQQSTEPSIVQEGQIPSEIAVKVGEEEKKPVEDKESTTQVSEEGTIDQEKPSVEDKTGEEEKTQAPVLETDVTENLVKKEEESAYESLPTITANPIESVDDSGTQIITTVKPSVESSESPISPSENVGDEKTNEETKTPTITEETSDDTTKISPVEDKEENPPTAEEKATEASIVEVEITSTSLIEPATDKAIVEEAPIEESVAESVKPESPEKPESPATVADKESTNGATEQPAKVTEKIEISIPVEEATEASVLPSEFATDAAIPEESTTVAEGKPSVTGADETPAEDTSGNLETEEPARAEITTDTSLEPEKSTESPAVSENKTEKPLEKVPVYSEEAPIQELDHSTQTTETPDDETTESLAPGGEQQEHGKPFEEYGPPAGIPGEGNCLVDGQSYSNNSFVPPANPCQLSCRCASSIVQCELVECSPPPSHLSNCMPVHNFASRESCCPMYSCDSIPTVSLEADNQMRPEDRLETTPALTEAPATQSPESSATETRLPATEIEEPDKTKPALTSEDKKPWSVTVKEETVASVESTEPTHVETPDATTATFASEAAPEKEEENEPIEASSESPVLPEDQTTGEILTEQPPEFINTAGEQETPAQTTEEPFINVAVSDEEKPTVTVIEHKTEAAQVATSPEPIVAAGEIITSTPATSTPVESAPDQKEPSQETERPTSAEEKENGTFAPTESVEIERETIRTPITGETVSPDGIPGEAATEVGVSSTASQEETTGFTEQSSSVAPAAEDENLTTTPPQDIASSTAVPVVNKIAEESEATTAKPQQVHVEIPTENQESGSSTQSSSEQAATETSVPSVVGGETPVETAKPAIERTDEQKEEQATTTAAPKVPAVEKEKDESATAVAEDIATTIKPQESPVETSSAEPSQDLPVGNDETTKVPIEEESSKTPEKVYNEIPPSEADETAVTAGSTVETTEGSVGEEKATTVVTKTEITEEETGAPVITEKSVVESTVAAATESPVEEAPEDSQQVTLSQDAGNETAEVTSSSVEKPGEIPQVPKEETQTVETPPSLPESLGTDKVEEVEIAPEEKPSGGIEESSSPSTEQSGEITPTQAETEDEGEKKETTSLDSDGSVNQQETTPGFEEATTQAIPVEKATLKPVEVAEENVSVVPSIPDKEQQHEIKDEETVKEDKPSGEDIIKEIKPSEEEMIKQVIPSQGETTEKVKPSEEAVNTGSSPVVEPAETTEKEVHDTEVTESAIVPGEHDQTEAQEHQETESQQTLRPEEEPVEEPMLTANDTAMETSGAPAVDDLEYPENPVESEENSHFPVNSGSYLNPDEDYDENDQDAYGPGTCRYGGKVYVSAQQIPREDPCDFCFCFRSDIICLQQSCPPPIPGCHEEPIRGFCCPRYECPVSMATSLNLTTTTTTTTTTLPPHFLSHAYKGAARQSGCQIRGQAYRVGQVIKSASGPCRHCTCGGDGNMKCDPRVCSPEPTLRQMIAAATARRRR